MREISVCSSRKVQSLLMGASVASILEGPSLAKVCYSSKLSSSADIDLIPKILTF